MASSHSAFPLVALILALAACDHPAPFAGGSIPEAGPATAPPVRLTFNPLHDVTPRWLPGGSGILYSFEERTGERNGRPVYDRCLGLLPPDGGTRRESMCAMTDLTGDSAEALLEPAPSPDGRLVWVETHYPMVRDGIRLGTWGRTSEGSVLQELPFTAPSGRAYKTVTHLAWLGPFSLVFIGADRAILPASSDTLPLHQEIALLALDAAGAIVAPVPGTVDATAVAPDAGGTAIYYTLMGDSRVFRQQLATGEVSVLHDFGVLGIARDPDVTDSTLVAVVGGNVFVLTLPAIGTVQLDRGGVLYRVDLRSHLATEVPLPGKWVRRPTLESGARRVVVEAFDTLPVQLPPAGDLYLMSLP